MKRTIGLICVLLALAALSLPVLAADFTPSVEQKGAPAAVEKEVTVVSLADLAEAPAEVRKVMEMSYTAIMEKGLAGLPAVKAAVPQQKLEKLVVRDLFYVTADQAPAEGEEKVITFRVEGIRKADFLMVMVFVDGQWVVLDADKVEITADGTVQVSFFAFGPVAFVTGQ